MQFTEDTPGQGYFITGYDEAGISINGIRHTASLVIAPNALATDWPPGGIAELDAGHFTTIIELEPELVILGTGPSLTFPQVETYAELVKLGIAVDVMDTGAACRTYNILVSEGRRVVAGIILPG